MTNVFSSVVISFGTVSLWTVSIARVMIPAVSKRDSTYKVRCRGSHQWICDLYVDYALVCGSKNCRGGAPVSSISPWLTPRQHVSRGSDHTLLETYKLSQRLCAVCLLRRSLLFILLTIYEAQASLNNTYAMQLAKCILRYGAIVIILQL